MNEEDWLAELGALESKPLSGIRFARGLSSAARRIRAEAGLPAPSPSYEALSRAFEINLSLLLLIFLSPLLVSISLAVKLEASGPIFIRKIRLGRGGTPFLLLGFRTIRIDRAVDEAPVGDPSKIHCPRFEPPNQTRVGRLLERSSLDSMPAFINLLRGEIALVGPPPQRAAAQEGTLSVRPGIFSWQGLVEVGGIDIDLAEAMRRDRTRGLRSDVQLLLTLFRFEILRRPPAPR